MDGGDWVCDRETPGRGIRLPPRLSLHGRGGVRRARAAAQQAHLSLKRLSSFSLSWMARCLRFDWSRSLSAASIPLPVEARVLCRRTRASLQRCLSEYTRAAVRATVEPG